MRCKHCNDLHEKGGLGVRDQRVDFGLGNCGSPDGNHDWIPARFIFQLPLVIETGHYKMEDVSVETASKFITERAVSAFVRDAAYAAIVAKTVGTSIPWKGDGAYAARMEPTDQALVAMFEHGLPSMEKLVETKAEGVEVRFVLLTRLR